jgi:hypothetical protein
MGRACGRHEENRNTYGVLVLKSLKGTNCFDTYAKLDDNKMNLNETGWEGTKWMDPNTDK